MLCRGRRARRRDGIALFGRGAGSDSYVTMRYDDDLDMHCGIGCVRGTMHDFGRPGRSVPWTVRFGLSGVYVEFCFCVCVHLRLFSFCTTGIYVCYFLLHETMSRNEREENEKLPSRFVVLSGQCCRSLRMSRRQKPKAKRLLFSRIERKITLGRHPHDAMMQLLLSHLCTTPHLWEGGVWPDVSFLSLCRRLWRGRRRGSRPDPPSPL